MAPSGYTAWSAGEIAGLVRDGQVSAGEVTEAALAAWAQVDGSLDAFCTLAAEQARAAAAAIDVRRARGETLGALAGVPVGIKDLLLTRGLRTTFGSPLYESFVPEVDDIVVERLRAADAVILGKTNASEFGFTALGHNPLFPTTRNPWRPDCTTGGSSAGSAAAVAARICPLAVGSDGGGSVRVPASFCGLVGIKPSMGRVPVWPGCRDPSLPGASGWESIEHIGPLARSVADAALMLQVMAGPDPRDRLSIPDEGVGWQQACGEALPPLRVGFCPRWGDGPVAAEVAQIVAAAVAHLARVLDLAVDEIASPFGDEMATFRTLVALETDLTGLDRLAGDRRGALSAPVQAILAARWTDRAFTDAITRRKALVGQVAAVMARYDVLLTPTLPLAAFPVDREGPGEIDGVALDDAGWMPFCYPFNLTGQPAASLPVGLTADGRPVGLQVVGRHLADRRLIALCAAIEASGLWQAERRPPVCATG